MGDQVDYVQLEDIVIHRIHDHVLGRINSLH